MQYSPQLAQMMHHDCWAEGTLSRAVGTLLGEVRYIEFGHRRNWWRLLRKQGAWLETAGKDFSCEKNKAKKKKKRYTNMNQNATKNVPRHCVQLLTHSQRFCSQVQKERIVSRSTATKEVPGFGGSINVVRAEQRTVEDWMSSSIYDALISLSSGCDHPGNIYYYYYLYSDLPVSLSHSKFYFQHLFALLPLCFQVGLMCQGIVTEG